MFTARLLCYRLVCRTRTGLQHIQTAWWHKRYVQAAISWTNARLVLVTRQLDVQDAAPFTLRKKVGRRPDKKAGDGRRGFCKKITSLTLDKLQTLRTSGWVAATEGTVRGV
jgi:hypothetical protein